MLNIALTNLGQYNEGILNYVWLSLPASDEEIAKAYDSIHVCHDGVNYCNDFGSPYEESFITDYECDFGYEVGEYDNLSKLNDMAEQYEALSHTEQLIVHALLDDGESFEDAIEIKDDCVFMPDCDDMEDVAREQLEDDMYNYPEYIQDYFDYEAYGEYLENAGRYLSTDEGMIQVCR